MVGAANNAAFAELCERLGVGELADDERFRTNHDRVVNREALLAILKER